MSAVPPVKVNIQPDKSCNNWKCCFGCRCGRQPKEEIQSSPKSIQIDDTEVIETVVKTYERHRHSAHTNLGSPIPRYPSPLLGNIEQLNAAVEARDKNEPLRQQILAVAQSASSTLGGTQQNCPSSSQPGS